MSCDTDSITISVRCPGETHRLSLQKSDCIYRINEEIGNQENIPSFRVRIVSEGNVLCKHKSIEYYGINNETVLRAEFLSLEEISLHINIRKDQRCILLNVQSIGTVNDIKTAIESSEGIKTSRQVLSFCGYLLSTGSMPLFDIGISNGDILDLEMSRIVQQESTINSGKQPTNKTEEDFKRETFPYSEDVGKKTFEIVFSVNCTDIPVFRVEKIKQDIQSECEKLLHEMPHVRFAFLAHGNKGDLKNHVFYKTNFTCDIDSIEQFIQNSKKHASQKTDCYEWVLHSVLKLNWNAQSHKLLIVIGDCEPHLPSLSNQNIDWHSELDLLQNKAITVYTALDDNFFGSVVDDFYPELCKKTNGCLIKQKSLKLTIDQYLLEHKEKSLKEDSKTDLDYTKSSDVIRNETDENNNSEIACYQNNKDMKLDDKSPQLCYFSVNKETINNSGAIKKHPKYKVSKRILRKHKQGCVVM